MTSHKWIFCLATNKIYPLLAFYGKWFFFFPNDCNVNTASMEKESIVAKIRFRYQDIILSTFNLTYIGWVYCINIFLYSPWVNLLVWYFLHVTIERVNHLTLPIIFLKYIVQRLFLYEKICYKHTYVNIIYKICDLLVCLFFKKSVLLLIIWLAWRKLSSIVDRYQSSVQWFLP